MVLSGSCCCLVTKCLTFCSAMDCGLPGSSVPGISQARMPERGALSFSRGFSQPRDQSHVSCIGRWVLYHWASQLALLLTGSRFLPPPLLPLSRCSGFPWVFTSVLRMMVFGPTDERARGRWRRRSWAHAVPTLTPTHTAPALSLSQDCATRNTFFPQSFVSVQCCL